LVGQNSIAILKDQVISTLSNSGALIDEQFEIVSSK
jgi:hypothetical protein